MDGERVERVNRRGVRLLPAARAPLACAYSTVLGARPMAVNASRATASCSSREAMVCVRGKDDREREKRNEPQPRPFF